MPLKARPTEDQNPVMNTASNGSQVALTKSVSLETPIGVLRQTSSSNIEPVRMLCVHSQDTYRREMSLMKLKSMPAITEDDDVSSDEEATDTKHGSRGKVAAKGNNKTPCECCKKYHVVEGGNKTKHPGKTGRIGSFVRDIFSCTTKTTADDQRRLAPDILLDVRAPAK